MAPVVLGYWGIRGLAQPIRLMLEYTGTEWEDKVYTAQDAWLKDKPVLGLDFPNLPYLFDGDVKLTQSRAILRYVARKHNLEGDTDEEKARVDLAGEEISDFRSAYTGLCYNPDFENLKTGFLEALPTKLEAFSKFLGKGKWLAGDKLTFVDFLFYELLDQLLIFAKAAFFVPYPNLVDYHLRFENMEPIAAYRASPRFIKLPLNGPSAKFGGTKEMPA